MMSVSTPFSSIPGAPLASGTYPPPPFPLPPSHRILPTTPQFSDPRGMLTVQLRLRDLGLHPLLQHPGGFDSLRDLPHHRLHHPGAVHPDDHGQAHPPPGVLPLLRPGAPVHRGQLYGDVLLRPRPLGGPGRPGGARGPGRPLRTLFETSMTPRLGMEGVRKPVMLVPGHPGCGGVSWRWQLVLFGRAGVKGGRLEPVLPLPMRSACIVFSTGTRLLPFS